MVERRAYERTRPTPAFRYLPGSHCGACSRGRASTSRRPRCKPKETAAQPHLRQADTDTAPAPAIFPAAPAPPGTSSDAHRAQEPRLRVRRRLDVSSRLKGTRMIVNIGERTCAERRRSWQPFTVRLLVFPLRIFCFWHFGIF